MRLAELPQSLGVAAVVDSLCSALVVGNAVLEAEPGAGKSTGVPLALLDESWLAGQRILMLEPRRLAARAVAERLAENRGEPLGQTVGLSTRDDRVGGAAVRIEVITEGLLTRRLQQDPELGGVGLVIFDEFHERSLQSDLALALCLDSQSALRSDLRLLLMSATVNRSALARVLDDAPVIHCAGRQHPVEVIWCARPSAPELVQTVCKTVREAVSAHDGDVLVFLPGMREIRAVVQRLSQQLPAGIDAVALHGSLSNALQRSALRVAEKRRVIVSSAIAETSVTLPGVRVVVDAGLERRAEYEAGSGATRLRTVDASQASASQRAGRAGRTAPGWCYRLWSESTHTRRASHWQAEVEHADLSDLVLQLRLWGVQDVIALRWQDVPPAPQVAAAESLLRQLGALDAKGQVTADGRILAQLGLPVRLAALALLGKVHGCAEAALALVSALAEAGRGESDSVAFVVAGDRKRLERNAQRVRSRLRGIGDKEARPLDALLAQVYADRIAVLRVGSGHRYQLSNGLGASLGEQDSLIGTPCVVAFELSGAGRDARITRAQPLDLDTVLALNPGLVSVQDRVQWDDKSAQVVAERRRLLGAITLHAEPLHKPDASAVCTALMEAVRAQGLWVLGWSETEIALQHRVTLFSELKISADEVPAFDDDTLLGELDQWLAPHAIGIKRLSDIKRVALMPLLLARLPWSVRAQLDQVLPIRVPVPSGRDATLSYREGGVDLNIKLQEMFGTERGPVLAGGRVPVRMHLLSPAGRALAVTEDLESFWRQAYPEVRKQTRGRYPKHPWPEDPVSATPTAYTKARAAGVKRKP